MSYFELLDTVENTALATTNAYIDVLRQRELVLLAEGNLNKHVTVFRQIEESSRAGVARAADLEQINGRLSLAESNLLVEIANLHDV
ncbi:TolC family protein, partial [Klebsiella pneumoniae]